MGMVYFVIAVTMGVMMIINQPDWVWRLRSTHVHLNLLGWIAMTIYGVGYHILPRFRGKPLHSDALANWQFWLANIGIVGLAVCLPFYQEGGLWQGAAAIFGAISALSIYLFVYNMWKTLA